MIFKESSKINTVCNSMRRFRYLNWSVCWRAKKVMRSQNVNDCALESNGFANLQISTDGTDFHRLSMAAAMLLTVCIVLRATSVSEIFSP
jgi:hypothetical protein